MRWARRCRGPTAPTDGREPRSGGASTVRCGRYYLKHPDTSPGTLAGVADSFLRDAGHSLLAFRERQGVEAATSDPFTFAGLATLNPTTSSACLNFVEGARRLHGALAVSAPNSGVIDTAYGLMNDLWEQSLHVRAVGVLVADAARTTGCLDELGRSLAVTIKPSDGARAQVVVVTS